MVTMTIDHFGYILTPSYASYLQLIGRISFPIFVLLMVFNLSKTDILKKYILRLSSFAILSSVVLFHFKNTLGELLPLNIFWSLLLGIVSIYYINKVIYNISNKYIKYFVVAYILIFCSFLSFITDYEIFGLFYILSLYGWFKSKNLIFGILSLVFAFLINIHISIPASIISFIITIIFLFPLTQSKKAKRFLKPWWLFYTYYPLHLVILYAVRLYY